MNGKHPNLIKIKIKIVIGFVGAMGLKYKTKELQIARTPVYGGYGWFPRKWFILEAVLELHVVFVTIREGAGIERAVSDASVHISIEDGGVRLVQCSAPADGHDSVNLSKERSVIIVAIQIIGATRRQVANKVGERGERIVAQVHVLQSCQAVDGLGQCRDSVVIQHQQVQGHQVADRLG